MARSPKIPKAPEPAKAPKAPEPAKPDPVASDEPARPAPRVLRSDRTKVELDPAQEGLRADVDRLTALNVDHARRTSVVPVDRMPAMASCDGILRAMAGAAKRFTDAGCQIKISGDVLELGPGAHPITSIANNWFGSYRGVDVVPAFAEGPVELRAVEALPLAWSGMFTWIYSNRCMEHTFDPALAIREVARVLAPEGIVGAVMSASPEEPSRLSVRSVNEWSALYRENGLRVVYIVTVDHGGGPDIHLIAVHPEMAALIGA